MMYIETKRLKLISCDKTILQAMLAGRTSLEKLLQITIPEMWTEFGTEPIKWALNKTNDASELNWVAYLPILKSQNMLIGTCGYKGKPNDQGMVEIGYEVVASKRNHGYAKEMASALIKHAFLDPRVKKIWAHTLPVENASVNVLQYCGLRFIGNSIDPEEGEVWKWELLKENEQQSDI